LDKTTNAHECTRILTQNTQNKQNKQKCLAAGPSIPEGFDDKKMMLIMNDSNGSGGCGGCLNDTNVSESHFVYKMCYVKRLHEIPLR
jgi:hypothetical protein